MEGCDVPFQGYFVLAMVRRTGHFFIFLQKFPPPPELLKRLWDYCTCLNDINPFATTNTQNNDTHHLTAFTGPDRLQRCPTLAGAYGYHAATISLAQLLIPFSQQVYWYNFIRWRSAAVA